MIYVVAVSVLLGASTLVYVYKTAYHPQTKVGKETEATKTRPALPAFDTSDANRGWKLVFEDNFSLRDAGITPGESYNYRRTFFKRKHAEEWASKMINDPGFIRHHDQHVQSFMNIGRN